MKKHIARLQIISALVPALAHTAFADEIHFRMSPDANPVAWTSAPSGDAAGACNSFTRSHTMVARIRQEDLLGSPMFDPLDGGLFSIGFTPKTDSGCWIWSTADDEGVLNEVDAEWWIVLTGMHRLGNIPFETDPRREHFPGNTIANP